MFNLILLTLSSIKKVIHLIFFFVKCGLGINQSIDKIKGEHVKGCIVEMKKTLSDMRVYYAEGCVLPVDVSNETERVINTSLRISPYIDDKEFAHVLSDLVEVFTKIKNSHKD